MREAKKHCLVEAALPEGSDSQLTDILDQMSIPYHLLPRARNIKSAAGLFQKLKRHRDKVQSERALLKFLDKQDLKNSVLHIELAPWHSLLALKRVCRNSGQVFITMHNRIQTASPLRRALWKAKLSLAARLDNFHILASNNDAKESLRSIAPAKLVDDIKVTYTSINPEEIDLVLAGDFDRAGLSEKFGLAAEKFTVLCVGQFIDRKGRWVFLEAAKKVLKSLSDIQFIWVSNYKPNDEELAKIKSYGLDENFKLITSDLIGNDRRDLLRMYCLGDVFVLPSFVEGLPIALLEAMAMRLPAVSTNINGIPEAVIDRETGRLVEPGDAKGLAAAIVELKNDEGLRKKLAENGRRTVLEKFDEREAAKIAWKSYKEAFEGQ
jgi:glycosyltransferase involved in cell wall biosynthesis